MNLITIWSILALLCPAYSIATRLLQVLRILHNFKAVVTKKIRILNSCCEVGAFANSLQSRENGT